MKLKQCLSSIAIICLPFAVAFASPWPTSAPDNVTTPVNQSIRIDVLANDSGEGLKLRKVNDWSVNGGRARINDDGVSVTYQPRNDYQGTDVFWYNFQDNQGRTNAAKVTVRVEADISLRPNQWPVAKDDFKHIKTYWPNNVISESAYIPIDVLLNDEGVGLSLVSINEWTANGNVVRMSNDRKSVTFRSLKPFSSWPFVDEFWYVFEDNWGRKNAGKVQVLLSTQEKPDAWPKSLKDSAQTRKNTSTVIDVLGNDTGFGLSLNNVNKSSVRWGRVTIAGDKVSYTPYKDYVGEDEFWYSFQDFWGRTNSAKVNVTVTSDK